MERGMVFIIAIICIIAIILCSCSGKASTPVVNVATIDDSGAISYSSILDNGKLDEVEAFTVDVVKTYDITNDFDYKSVKNLGFVSLKSSYLIDEDGNETQADDEQRKFMQALADISHHPLWNVQMIEDAGQYFAFVKHNVNWWTPCILYKYDAENNKAVKLYEWDDVDLQGIKILEK